MMGDKDSDVTGVRSDRGQSRASRESDNETGDELGDYKEPQEEELSLLGHSLDTNTPVPIIRAPINRHKHYSAGQTGLSTVFYYNSDTEKGMFNRSLDR